VSRQFAGTGGGNQGISFSTSAGIVDLSAFAIILWFYATDNSGGSNFASMFGEYDGSNGLTIQMKTTGAVNFNHQDGSSTINVLSSAGFDDSAWHWLAFLRRGATDYEFYIDGVSEGTSSTNVGTIGTAPNPAIGNPSGSNVLPSGGRLAHLVTVPASILIAEATTMSTGVFSRATNLFVPLGYGSPEPDYSGNGYDGTVTGTSIAAKIDEGPLSGGFVNNKLINNSMVGGGLAA